MEENVRRQKKVKDEAAFVMQIQFVKIVKQTRTTVENVKWNKNKCGSKQAK